MTSILQDEAWGRSSWRFPVRFVKRGNHLESQRREVPNASGDLVSSIIRKVAVWDGITVHLQSMHEPSHADCVREENSCNVEHLCGEQPSRMQRRAELQ